VASPAVLATRIHRSGAACTAIRLFGLHLSAVRAAWTERRRVFELRSLLRSIAEHQGGFHVLAGDFNTLAPGEDLDLKRLPPRLRPFVWLSGGRIRWRTIREVVAAGYVDAFRLRHPDDPGLTMRRRIRMCGWTTSSCRTLFASASSRVMSCERRKPSLRPTTCQSSPIWQSTEARTGRIAL